MKIKHKLRRLLWKIGYDVTKFESISHPMARRKQLLADYGVDTILDVGANSGQFATELRCDMGYVGRIISFEPLSSAFQLLEKNSKGDMHWETCNFALGEVNESREINIAGNSDSSSILEMLNSHLASAPESAYIGRERIEVKSLDSIFPDLCAKAKNVYLKIDTQGYEQQVLRGAAESLLDIDTVHMEMSLVHLYEGEMLIYQMCEFMYQRDYVLVSLEPNFADRKSGRLLQVDGIFHRFQS